MGAEDFTVPINQVDKMKLTQKRLNFVKLKKLYIFSTILEKQTTN